MLRIAYYLSSSGQVHVAGIPLPWKCPNGVAVPDDSKQEESKAAAVLC